MIWINGVLLALSVACLAPAAVLCAECLLALLPGGWRRRHPAPALRPKVAVLIPAYNEESGLEATIRTIRPELVDGDEILVVADNCTDRTAAVARRLGVSVVERFDARERGKGFALDCGIAHLGRSMHPPGVVVMIDADCTLHPGSMEALVRQVIHTDRPAQACYLMERPPSDSPRDKVSALAFLVKNLVRPTGLRRAGMPCLLTGAGMAFPWKTISTIHLATGNIVEDMQLSLDLALRGKAPLFCTEARITGRLPAQIKVAYGQRTRWEHGHLQTVLTQVPRLFKAGVVHRAGQALALALDLFVPPLALLMMLLLSTLAAASIAGWFGASWWPARLIGCGVVAIAIGLFGAWVKFGRRSLPFQALLAAPVYMIWKAPMYAAFLFRRQTVWNRTERSEPVVQEFELPPVGAGGDFDRDYNRDVLPQAEAPVAHLPLPAQLKLGDLIRPTRTVDACIDHIVAKLALYKGGTVVLPTVEHLQWCATDPQFARVIAGAELVCDDGGESLLNSTPAVQASFVRALIRAAVENHRSLFLLGDDAETTAEAAASLTLIEPSLRLAGIYSAPDGFDSDHIGRAHVGRAVVRAKPDVVLVALGTPQQEKLIDQLQQLLPSTWWIAVGSSFEFIARETRRSRGRSLSPATPAEPLDELGQVLARGVSNITIADRLPANASLAGPPSTMVYQSFLMALREEQIKEPVESASPDLLRKLKAVVLLGGSIRPSALTVATGRSVLDLPLEDGRSILWHWRDHVMDLREKLSLEILPIHVLVDPHVAAPTAPQRGVHVPVFVHRDATEYRGTAGVLRDLIADKNFAEDDYVLVATAAQVLVEPLWRVATQLAERGGDAVVISHDDETPCGLMLVRCGAAQSIPAIGFVDLKEQALPQLARTLDVRHVQRTASAGLSIQSASEYVAAVQFRHRQQLSRPNTHDPFAEDRRPSFSVIEEQVSIHPHAQIHDSIVMQGARVAEGAVVIRSVVCPGANLSRNQSLIDGLCVS